MTKNTKLYESVSGDFAGQIAAVGSSEVGSDRFWKSVLYLINFRIDKDAYIDKEYTGIDKISMCICGQCASLAAQAIRTIGCDLLLRLVSSVWFVAQNRSQTGVIVRASSWGWWS